jgi:Sulfotransferase domain
MSEVAANIRTLDEGVLDPKFAKWWLQSMRCVGVEALLSLERGMGVLKLDLLREIALGAVPNQHVFVDVPRAGSGCSYVICNAAPKSGTYLLVELVKALGCHVDVGYHTYSSSISKVHADGSFDYERAVPAPLWASALQPGYLCASHTEYCPYLEQYFLTRKEHKMLFIVRDPRDIVISWVDFVYNSAAYPNMRKWNAYLRNAGTLAHPDDASQISSCIVSLLESGIKNYLSWLDSPACLTVRFEELYRELMDDDPKRGSFPVLDGICDYLDVPRRPPREIAGVLGRGLTASSRHGKIGVYRSRMTADHLDLLRDEAFQKLVVEFGYEPTPPADAAAISIPKRALRGLARRFAVLRDGLGA